MKSISKLLQMFFMGTVSFSDPHLHKNILNVCTHSFTKKQKCIEKYGTYDIHVSTKKTEQVENKSKQCST